MEIMKNIAELIEHLRETEMKKISLFSEARHEDLREPKHLPCTDHNS